MTTANAPIDGSLAAITNPGAPEQPGGPHADLRAALEALDCATDGYKRAADYYSGTTPEFFASPRMRWAMMRTGIAFRLNFARIPVDAVAERLRLSAVTSPDQAADAELQGIWKRNKLALQSREIVSKASELGDAYVMVWPSTTPDDLDGDVDVDVQYNHPASIRVIYDEANPLIKRYAIKRWTQDGRLRADLIYPDRIEKWITKPGTTGKNDADWIDHYDDPADPWPLINPYGVVPVFHFRNGQPYGEPEHAGFYGPQDLIHKLAVSHASGIDYASFPQRYALADGATDSTELADQDEDVFSVADATTGDTRPPGGEPRSQLTGEPASLWFMRGVKQMGQFDPAPPTVFTEPMLHYLRAGAEITNTPLHRIDPTGDQPSGQSLRAAEAPFVAKVSDRMLAYGDTWEELFRFALLVAGFPDAELNVQWEPAQTVDDVDGWNTVLLKIQAGVPARQALIEAGYDAALVDEWELERQAQEKAAQQASQAALEAAQAAAQGQPQSPPTDVPADGQKPSDGAKPANAK